MQMISGTKFTHCLDLITKKNLFLSKLVIRLGFLWNMFMIVQTSSLPSLFGSQFLTSYWHSVVWRILRQGWVRSVDGAHRRVATARADLKVSEELAFMPTVLIFILFQAIRSIVRGRSTFFLYCSVLQLGMAIFFARLFVDRVLDDVVWVVKRSNSWVARC